MSKQFSRERIVLSTNGAGTTGDPYQNMNLNPDIALYTKLTEKRVDHRLKQKQQQHKPYEKLLEENRGRNLCDLS